MKNEDLHLKFTEYGKNAKEWLKKCALLLPEIQKRRIWEKKGFSSIYEYAAKLAGMSRHQVENALRIMRKIEDKPHLKAVVEKKGLNSVRPVLSVLNSQNERFWAGKAMKMSKNVLETYIREIKKQNYDSMSKPEDGMAFPSEKSGKIRPSTDPGYPLLTMKLKPEIIYKLNKLKGSGDFNDLMEKFIKMYEESLGKPETAKTKAMPQRIKKFVIKKTNGVCAFPGCSRPGSEKHHAERHAITRNHDPDKIHLLCKEHHRLAHYGLIENENSPPETWKIQNEPESNTYKSFIDQFAQMKFSP